MKRKFALIFGLVLITVLSFGSGVVISQTSSELPRLTTACETRVGGVLLGVNDGYSSLKFCPKNTRKVVLGEKLEGGGSGSGEVKMNYENIAFGGSFVLTKDGRVWKYNPITNPDWGVMEGWKEYPENKLPIEVIVGDIAEWDGVNGEYFVTKNGDLYNLFPDRSWTKMADVSMN